MPITPDRWRPVGIVTVSDNGDPEFPTLPALPTKSTTAVPGNYRLTFKNGYIYIGKTKDLRRRFGNYRKPSQGTEQEHVLRYILVDAGGARVDVIPESDLPEGTTRHEQEREQLNAAINAGRPVLNTGGQGRGVYLKFKVKYHEDMLCNAIAELKSWNRNAGK